MANVLPFLIMTEQQAARFREETAGDDNRLEPRLVEAGPQKGKYALPERVMYDEAYADRRDAFRMLTAIQFDTEVAWPPQPDE